MNTFADFLAHPVWVWAGWTAVLVLWPSTSAALVFAIWRLLRARSAASQHRGAMAVLGLSSLGLIGAPFALASWPDLATANVTPAYAPVPVAAPALLAGIRAEPHAWNAVAGIVGLAWAVGSACLVARLAGGWLLIHRIRRRALPLEDSPAREALDRVTARMDPGCDVILLESRDVEAPVVVGARQPTLILPDDLVEQLGVGALEPLLAHECEHIRRGDYMANLLQSIVEAGLFFSPAVRWASRVARESREYCCDDVAVRCCDHDRGGYARLLATLAALGSRNRAQTALGAAGPRLIDRVRRLLKEDTMQPRANAPTSMTFAACAALAVLAFTFGSVLRISAAQAMAAPLRVAGGAGQSGWEVPIGYATRQPGSSVVLGPVATDADYLASEVTLKNEADTPLSSVVLVAVVSTRNAHARGPVVILTSEAITTNVQPGATATIPARFITRSQLAEVSRQLDGTERQVFFGVARTVFSNGAEWSTTPNPAARGEGEALGIPPASVPRRLVVDSPRSGPPSATCEDDAGLLTSEGGMVAVRDEPGRFAVCRNGSWVSVEVGAGRR